ncbi:MFS transporter [Lactonifactor sp. BIOML-A3]|uniref:MFS transporter n=1 Tax=Lactonifactor TaxID=420345 RepID=UPI0012AEF013|nr:MULTISPECIES: MFS transporter [Lactonifactor]MCB5713489.1 MFS transporter [Lactonifactor longoviformis]MCB5717588.1 MFS transporter [Lactonifactor longoviformis]MSA01122.1 MFS transporter [Lactonifactor sp. BIOML-A5]MSA09921.1 MFS transporter [Lactonifactor sp. BIOML-A4]MSA13044.1 MFS transporter [Lactonifactor sp. BIOML-A3]
MNNEVNIVLDPKKKRLVILASIIMYFNYMFANMGCGLTLPRLLGGLNAMDIYATVLVFSSVGLMIASPVSGKLGDTLGRKWITIFSLAGFLICAAITGMSPNGWMLMVFWALTGICGGFFVSASFSMIADVTTIEERPKYIGYLATAAAVGQLAGPLLAGVLADNGLVRGPFFVGIPLGIVVICLYASCYPHVKLGVVSENNKIDILGLFLLVVSICSIVFFLNFGNVIFPRTSPIGIALLIIGIVGFIALIIFEYNAKNPVVSVRLFKYKEFRIAWICHFLYTMYIVVVSGYLVLFGQNVMKVSVTVSSTFAMPQTICSAVLASFVGLYISKSAKNYKKIYIFMGLCGAIPLLAWAFFLTPSSSVILIYITTLIGGAGYACDQVVNTPYLQSTMPKENYGAAQGMLIFAGSAAGTVCGAVSGVILNRDAPLEESLGMIFLIFGICLFLIFIIGLTSVRTRAEVKE